MNINFNKNELDSANSLFDKEYFENMDLNDDMEKIYSLVDNEDEYNEYEKEMNLSKLRIDNHKKYYRIKINLIEDLPNYFYLDVKNIKNIYSKINKDKLLISNYEEAEKEKYRLIEIEKAFDELKFKVEKELKKLLKNNNKDQKPWSFDTFKNLTLDEEELKKVLNCYNTLLFITANVYDDVFSEYKNEIKRKKIIDKIKKILDEEAEKLKNSADIKELRMLNKKISDSVNKLQDKIEYLEKLIPEDSKYISDYNKFKKLCNTLINYNKSSLKDAKETYKVICLQDKIDIFIKRFERLFLQEVENSIKGKDYKRIEQEINEIKDIIKNIDEYYEYLNKEDNKYIRNLTRKIKSKIINIKEEKEQINNIIKKVWHEYLTDIYTFNPKEEYHFICSNNQFIEPKYESILITKEMINKGLNYGNYQIGFICNNVDNIIYMTKKENIMEAESEELQFLKLPNQICKSINNFKDAYKIALDGNKIVFTAVYFIDDNDIAKLSKAIELANMYNIPLIKLKRDN